MRKPTYASKKARAATGWWKHARPSGKRMANKSERKGAKLAMAEPPNACDLHAIATRSRA